MTERNHEGAFAVQTVFCFLAVDAGYRCVHFVEISLYCDLRFLLYVLVSCSPPGSPTVEFSTREYWSRLLFPSPGIFPAQGWNPRISCIAGRFFTV